MKNTNTLKSITQNLITQFHLTENVKRLDIIVSFIQLSGIKLMKPLLDQAIKRNIPIRILTSTYMNITDPTALLELHYLLGEEAVHLYKGQAPSFHPKAYFFIGEDVRDTHLFIGSSNISNAALTTGVEWNYKIEGAEDAESIQNYMNEFEHLFTHESYSMTKEVVIDYRDSYTIPNENRKKTNLNEHYNKHRIKGKSNYNNSLGQMPPRVAQLSGEKIYNLFQPNPAQREALLELSNTRSQGNEKALVVAATGVGKTFLAAFDSEKYDSILFLAHREEILNQAYDTFMKVHGIEDMGRLYDNAKEFDAKKLFASVQTLSRDGNLRRFSKDTFKYIIVDEVHHGTAPSYKKIIDYFEPEFMLGITATPHRLDKKDVFEIFDFNSVYEVDIFSAINRGWLVPYKYYGIYDATVDYNNVKIINGKYVEKDLEKALAINERAQLIYSNYLRYRRHNALAFCSNINHAEFMADYFNANGVRAVCVHSDKKRTNYCERNEAIMLLKNGSIDVIFSVNMFNEGVDIPSLDLLLFLRPTQSPVVFLQQLGRGLRTHDGKYDVRILDFIGNFKKVDLIPLLLGQKGIGKQALIDGIRNNDYLPMDCQVDFEFEVVDLLEKTINAKRKARDLIKSWYFDCKDSFEIARDVPTRMEFFNYLEEDKYQYIKSHGKFNPFKDFVSYVCEWEEEYVVDDVMDTPEHEFIKFIENTNMSKLYKMPVILSFLGEKGMKIAVTKEEIIREFKRFYVNNRNRLDLLTSKNTQDSDRFTDNQWWKIIESNPIHFLCKTHGDIFSFDGEKMWITLEFSSEFSEWFVEEVRDAIAFRRSEFLNSRLEK